MKVEYFAHLAEMPIHTPKTVFFIYFWRGAILPHKWGAVSMQPPKSTSLHENMSSKSGSTSVTCAYDYGTKKIKKKDKEPEQWQTGYSPRPPISSDWDTVLHGWWSLGGSCFFPSLIKISSAITAMWGVKIWPTALLRPMTYTSL